LGTLASVGVGLGGLYLLMVLFEQCEVTGLCPAPGTSGDHVAMVFLMVIAAAIAMAVLWINYFLYVGRRNDIGLDNSEMTLMRYLTSRFDPAEASTNVRLQT
jgi:hypothetical protein